MGQDERAAPGAEETRLRWEALLTQYKIASAELQTLKESYDKLFTIGMAALAALYVYGLSKPDGLAGAGAVDPTSSPNLVIIGHPFLLFAFLLYVFDLANATMALGGYKRFLEVRMNEIAKENVALWERVVPDVVHRPDHRMGNHAMTGIIAIYVAFMLVSIVTSLNEVGRLDPPHGVWLVGIEVAALGVLAALSVASWRNSMSKHRFVAAAAAGIPRAPVEGLPTLEVRVGIGARAIARLRKWSGWIAQKMGDP